MGNWKWPGVKLKLAIWAMSENGCGGQREWIIRSGKSGCIMKTGHVCKWKWWPMWVGIKKWPGVKLDAVVRVGGRQSVIQSGTVL